MGENKRHDPDHQRKVAERYARDRANLLLWDELESTLLTALRRGSDALHGVQHVVRHDLVRLKLLHPDIRFFDSRGQIANHIVQIPVGIPSSELSDLHELSSTQLIRIVRQRLHEDTRSRTNVWDWSA